MWTHLSVRKRNEVRNERQPLQGLLLRPLMEGARHHRDPCRFSVVLRIPELIPSIPHRKSQAEFNAHATKDKRLGHADRAQRVSVERDEAMIVAPRRRITRRMDDR